MSGHAKIYVILVNALLLLLLPFTIATADGDYKPIYNPELNVTKAIGNINIDGELFDPGWNGAAMADNFAEHRPGDQVEPPVKTEAFITYDDENLYVGFIAYDENPSAIRATLSDRDEFFQDDNVILALDSYGNAAWAYELIVNPIGVQGDIVWSQYGDEDAAPDFIWESAGKITDSGYQVEMAIPFTSLRFPDKKEQVWKADFWRNYPRETRYQMSWAAYDRNESCWPCQWGTLTGIKNVKPGKGIEFMPAFVGYQYGSVSDGSDPLSPWVNKKVDGELSLGTKYAISSDITTEVAINPDFSQIESDAAQVDVNSAFALYYPEKRPFFQEGIDLFNTFTNVVYTRQINNPLATAKVVGRMEKTSIAYMTAYDEDSPVIVPLLDQSETIGNGESFSNIFRVRRSIGRQSHLGGIISDRRYKDGGYNSVFGIDWAAYFLKNYSVKFQALVSSSEEINDTTLIDTDDLGQEFFNNDALTVELDGETFKGHSIYASVDRNASHWWFDIDYNEKSPAFRADNGFITRNGTRQIDIGTGYNTNYVTKIFDNISPRMGYGKIWKYNGGYFKDEWFWWECSFDLKGQTNIEFGGNWSDENYKGILFEGIKRFRVFVNSNFSDPVKLGFLYSRGHTITRNLDIPAMGKETLIEAWGTIKPLNSFTIIPSYNYTKSDDLNTGENYFDGYIFRTKFTYQFNKRLLCRLVVQYNDFADRWDVDPLVSYRVSPFSIFYIGASSGILDVDNHGLKQTERQFFIKLQHLFRI